MSKQVILSDVFKNELRKEHAKLNKIKNEYVNSNKNLEHVEKWLKDNEITVDYYTKTNKREQAIVISTYLLPQYKKEKLYNFANDKANKYKYLFLHGQSQYAYEQKKLAIVINSKKTLEHLFQVSNETANISNRLNLINQMLSA